MLVSVKSLTIAGNPFRNKMHVLEPQERCMMHWLMPTRTRKLMVYVSCIFHTDLKMDLSKLYTLVSATVAGALYDLLGDLSNLA